jgi:hypothetical protein
MNSGAGTRSGRPFFFVGMPDCFDALQNDFGLQQHTSALAEYSGF